MQTKTEKGSLSALTFIALLLPGMSLVAWVLFLVTVGLIDAYQWYEASAHAYQPSAWYAYPWHWPGVHLAEEGWNWLQGKVPLLNVPGSSSANDVSTWPLIAIFWLLRASTALFINLAIALLPLVVLGRLVTLTKWIHKRIAAKA